LFRVVQRYASVTHLCVAEGVRGAGIGSAMVDRLIEISSENLFGVRANTRQDYPVSKIWKKFGFTVSGEKPGRGADLTPVFTWRYEHSRAALWDYLQFPLPVAVLDTNTVLEIQDESDEDSVALTESWIREVLTLAITEQFRVDLTSNPNSEKRAWRLDHAHDSFELITAQSGVVTNIKRQLRSEITRSPGAVDLNHVSTAIAIGAKFFVTKDAELRALLETAAADRGLQIVEPSELIAKNDESIHSASYQPRRLLGTDLHIDQVRGSATIEELCDTFVNSLEGETKRQLRSALRSALSQPNDRRLYAVVDKSNNDQYRGLFVISESPQRIEISLLRTESSPLGELVDDQVTAWLIEQSIRADIPVIQVSDRFVRDSSIQSLIEHGFIHNSEGQMKISIPGIWDSQSLLDRIRTIPVESTNLQEQTSTFLESALHHEQLDTMEHNSVESVLFPAIISNGLMEYWIVPIQPQWATQLFESRTAEEDMFGPSHESMLRRDNVYYRSVVGPNLESPAKILWYVSTGPGTYPRSQTISAISTLESSQVFSAKIAYDRYAKYGAYSEEDVLRLADGDQSKPLNVLRFSRNILLPNPVALRMANEILRKANVSSNNFVGPLKISRSAALEIVRSGGINDGTHS